MRKIGTAALVLTGLLAVLAACGEQTPPPPTPQPAANEAAPVTAAPTSSAEPVGGSVKVLRIGTPTYPDILDPQKSSVINEINILQLAYEGLVRLDEKGNLQSASADHWESSPDGKKITFHIRDGLKRSDGTPLMCADFEYALKREVDPFTQGKLYTSIVLDVKGAKELIEYGEKTDPSAMSKDEVQKLYANYGVRCLDPQRLEVELVSPIGFWEYIASTWVTFPTDQRAVQRDPANWWTKAENHVGNGPFKIVQIEEGKRIILEANPNYWGGRPKIDRIEIIFNTDNVVLFEAFKKGELDVISALPEWLPEIEGTAALQQAFLRYPAASTTAFAFNNSRKPFDDRNVRIAFSEALDRAGYSNDVNKGTTLPYTRWIPPGVPGAQPDKVGVPETDFKAAVKTLVESGYAAPDSTPDNPKVDCDALGELKLTYQARPVEHARAAYIANNIIQVIGCPVILDPVDATVWLRLIKDVKTNPQISRQGWVQDYPHPQNWLTVYWTCGSFAMRYGYCNLKLDEMLHEADQTLDFEQAIIKYKEAEDLLLSDVPGAMAYYNSNLFLVAPYLVGPREHTSTSDGIFPGGYGPLTEYDIDLSRVPANYPRR